MGYLNDTKSPYKTEQEWYESFTKVCPCPKPHCVGSKATTPSYPTLLSKG